ncbi:MAG: tetratricopeptide repeat protein [Candidatus Eisenbacteria bacterium]
MRRNLGKAALACCLVFTGCVPNVTVRRSAPPGEKPVRNVAVVLFRDHGSGSPPLTAEVATDALSLELQKYFPDLVDRYRVRDWLRAKGLPDGALSDPATRAALGEDLGVDGIFTGALTGYGDKRSFLGWKGTPHIGLECKLILTKTGEEILRGSAAVSESYLIPAENPRDLALFGVRKMTRGMRLSERFGPPVLTRDDALWRQAMEAYERRRFWEAAEAFGAIQALYRPSDLRDEGALCLGRCLEELGLPEGAARTYAALKTGPMAARALARTAEVRRLQGRTEEALRAEAELASRFPGTPEAEGALYSSGLALLRSGETAAGLARLTEVPPNGSWGRFARFASVPILLSRGDSAAAIDALVSAAAEGGLTESERRLAEEARLALGHLHYDAGHLGEALRWYEAAARAGCEEAVLALGWIAAEEGRHADAIALLAGVTESVDPRIAAEALLLRGSCRVRLEQWTEGGDDFLLALAACDRWKEEIPRVERLRDERAAAAAELLAEIEPRSGEIVSLLTTVREKEEDAVLRGLRARHQELSLRVERTARETEGWSEAEREEGRLAGLRERAEFSYAQVLYQNGAGNGDGLLVGARDENGGGR